MHCAAWRLWCCHASSNTHRHATPSPSALTLGSGRPALGEHRAHARPMSNPKHHEVRDNCGRSVR
eukprot:7390207-Prymnesium_polylepis.2